jgi:hypothetical protein
MKNNPKKCIICGSGASMRMGLWNTPIEELPVWRMIENQFTIACNWSYKWMNPSIVAFTDPRFYCTEKENLDKLPALLTTRKDGFYENKDRYGKYFDKIGDNVKFLQCCGFAYKDNICQIYNGTDEQGRIYTPQLTGLFALGYALSIGCKKIYLLGYDCCPTDGKTHFYEGDYTRTGIINWNDREVTGVGLNKDGSTKCSTYNNTDINWWFKPLTNHDSDVIIYNVGMNSKIDVFPKIDYATFCEHMS